MAPVGFGAPARPGTTLTGAQQSQRDPAPALPWTRPRGEEGGGGMMPSAQKATLQYVNLEAPFPIGKSILAA